MLELTQKYILKGGDTVYKMVWFKWLGGSIFKILKKQNKRLYCCQRLLDAREKGGGATETGAQKLMVHYITSGMHKNEFNLYLNLNSWLPAQIVTLIYIWESPLYVLTDVVIISVLCSEQLTVEQSQVSIKWNSTEKHESRQMVSLRNIKSRKSTFLYMFSFFESP